MSNEINPVSLYTHLVCVMGRMIMTTGMEKVKSGAGK